MSLIDLIKGSTGNKVAFFSVETIQSGGNPLNDLLGGLMGGGSDKKSDEGGLGGLLGGLFGK